MVSFLTKIVNYIRRVGEGRKEKNRHLAYISKYARMIPELAYSPFTFRFFKRLFFSVICFFVPDCSATHSVYT